MSKKGAKTKEEQSYDIRDVVLAKIRGYPAWPAMIVDPESVPKAVSKERPNGKKQNFYCVRFFPAGDYSWVLTKDMSKLKKHEIETYIAEPHKKNGDLLNGYRIALDPQKWEEELEERQMVIDQAEEEAEVDELEGEDEVDEDEKPAKAKKRKRESDVGVKPKAKPKKDRRLSEPLGKSKKSSSDKPPKSQKNGAKSNALVESEDEGDHEEDAGPSKKASPPPAKKVKKDKDGEDADGEETDPEAIKVKEWRHKFQKGFLGKSPAKADDMAQYDELFSTVEDYGMPLKYLQSSKIGKVMRHIAQKENSEIPRDDEFKFRDRAQALVNKWHQILSASTAHGTNGNTDSKKALKEDAAAEEAEKDEVAPDAAEKNEAMDVPEAEEAGDSVGDDAVDATVHGNGDISVLAEETNGDVNMDEA